MAREAAAAPAASFVEGVGFFPRHCRLRLPEKMWSPSDARTNVESMRACVERHRMARLPGACYESERETFMTELGEIGGRERETFITAWSPRHHRVTSDWKDRKDWKNQKDRKDWTEKQAEKQAQKQQ